MESEPSKAVQQAHDQKVPDELLQKLHQAHQRFHEAKMRLERVTGDSEYSHQQRIEQAEDEIRLAERDVEQATLEIHNLLIGQASGEPKH